MGGIELLERGRRDTRDVPFGDYIRGYIRDNSDMMTAIRRGLSDIKAGRVRPWTDIKKELRFG